MTYKIKTFKTEHAHNAYYYRHIKAKQKRNETIKANAIATLSILALAVAITLLFIKF